MFGESNEIESDWALKQLAALGYVSVHGHGREATFGITEKGRGRASEIMLGQHDIQERLLIILHCADLAEFAVEED